MDDAWSLFGDDTTDAPPAPPPPIAAAAAAATGAAAVDAALAVFAEITVPTPQPREHGEGSSSLWPAQPAKFMGPITLRSVDGMGRGFVAARDLEPGELLLVEAPLLRWPTAERHPAPLLRALASSPPAERAAALAALALLHPVAPLEATARARAEAAHGRTADELAPLWKGAECSRDELLRLCLVVQWNGFASGLFLHQSIFNHACPQFANCDKSAVAAGGGARGGGGAAAAAGGAPLSVVRATRPIARGEQCCISYVQPPELLAAERAERLRQFDFGCTCTGESPFDALAAAGGGKRRRADADDEAGARAIQGAAREVDAALGAPPEATEPLVRAALRPLRRACAGPRHLALAAAHRRIVAALGSARRLRAAPPACAALALECAVELWATQRALLGPLHPDGAETLRHVGALLQHLLASAPQLLFERFPDWGTAAAAAHAERRAMQLHAGIARLYDNERVAREAQE